jgi:hypothetical protein
MLEVNVFIYSYKNKNLIDTLINLISNESKNNKINYIVFDQNNYKSEKLFNKLDNVEYHHIYWDDWAYKNYYRSLCLLKRNGYYLEVNDKIKLNKNWDMDLIKYLGNKDIISGNGITKLYIDECFVKTKIENTKEVSLTNYVNFDLFFTKIINTGTLLNLQNIKMVGQELYASILYSINKKYIYSLPSDFYSIESMQDPDYYPFSKYHGYNKMLSKISKLNVVEFEKFHSIKIDKIKHMPYQVDDISFLKYTANIYNNKARFHDPYSKMEIM